MLPQGIEAVGPAEVAAGPLWIDVDGAFKCLDGLFRLVQIKLGEAVHDGLIVILHRDAASC